MTHRLRIRYVLTKDAPYRMVPGWYVIDTGYRPARTVHGPTDQDSARQMLAHVLAGQPML